jgi:hypothetical protein
MPGQLPGLKKPRYAGVCYLCALALFSISVFFPGFRNDADHYYESRKNEPNS